MTRIGKNKLAETEKIKIEQGILQGDFLFPPLSCMGLNPSSQILEDEREDKEDIY